MRETIPPFPNTSSSLDAEITIGETLPLPYNDLKEGRIAHDSVY
jgi:hypothetical protein